MESINSNRDNGTTTFSPDNSGVGGGGFMKVSAGACSTVALCRPFGTIGA